MRKRPFMTAAVAVALLGAGVSAWVAAGTLKGEMLLYQKLEPGVEPYRSRLIVTEQMMRLDDGVDDGDFALLDRKKRIIFSIAHDDRTVLEIPFRPVDVESPLKLDLSEKSVPVGEDAPTIAGKRPTHRRLSAGQNSCYDVVAVEGLLAESVEAMGEFREIMAGEHAATLNFVPADQQDACDLGVNIYRHGWPLEHGLPIQEWDGKGNGRMLVNFDADYTIDPALFELPDGYRHYRITPEE